MNCINPQCDGTLRPEAESETDHDLVVCDRCSTRYDADELDRHDYVTECIDWLKEHFADPATIAEMALEHDTNDELTTALEHAEWGVVDDPWGLLTHRFWELDQNGVLDYVVLTLADSHLPERPSALKRADAAGDIAATLPDALVEDFLESTLHVYATNTGDLHDLEFHLRMEQQFAEHTTRLNDDERRELWDEILKYTKYQFDARWTDHTEDGEHPGEFHEEAWKQNATPWRNAILTDKIASHHDTVEMHYVRVTPVKRREPQFDPLPDLEWFVYYDAVKPKSSDE